MVRHLTRVTLSILKEITTRCYLITAPNVGGRPTGAVRNYGNATTPARPYMIRTRRIERVRLRPSCVSGGYDYDIDLWVSGGDGQEGVTQSAI